MMSMSIELLSPAKNLETGKAAIDYGADAVYIGGPCFGARHSAANQLEDIVRLVNYAHLFRVKVYVVINTLLFDKELKVARALIWDLYTSKVDAIIIQDLGILELDLPPIPLFASTQTTNISVDKVKFLQDLGFKRVVLERALKLEEIWAIKQQTSIDLECFVHGATCVCYSGLCSLSYAVGGRSANRGQCGQPCRMRYTLLKANSQYLNFDY